jgi:hypothetical protein
MTRFYFTVLRIGEIVPCNIAVYPPAAMGRGEGSVVGLDGLDKRHNMSRILVEFRLVSAAANVGCLSVWAIHTTVTTPLAALCE